VMEIHQIGDLTLAGNLAFPTTSTGEVGKVGKQALNQHPHHHLSRGCGGVVGVARSSILQVGKSLPCRRACKCGRNAVRRSAAVSACVFPGAAALWTVGASLRSGPLLGE
jgi:hypothetical protein